MRLLVTKAIKEQTSRLIWWVCHSERKGKVPYYDEIFCLYNGWLISNKTDERGVAAVTLDNILTSWLSCDITEHVYCMQQQFKTKLNSMEDPCS